MTHNNLTIGQDFLSSSTLSLQQLHKLRIGDQIDHRDNVGRFCLALIIDKQGNRMKLHYDGWSNTWDTWCDFVQDYCKAKFAHAGSISKRYGTRFPYLRVGDMLDFHQISCPGWKMGCVRKIDDNSGQIQIVFRSEPKSNRNSQNQNNTSSSTSHTLRMNTSKGPSTVKVKYWQLWTHMDNPCEIAPFTAKSIHPDCHHKRVQFQIRSSNGQPKGMRFFEYLYQLQKKCSIFPCGELLVYGYFRRANVTYRSKQKISMLKVLPRYARRCVVQYIEPCLLWILSAIQNIYSAQNHVARPLNTNEFDIDCNLKMMKELSKLQLRVLTNWMIFVQPFIHHPIKYLRIVDQLQAFSKIGTLFLCPILRYNSHIQELILTNNCLDDHCLKLLVDSISHNIHPSPIALLDISGNIITDTGTDYLWNHLLCNNTKNGKGFKNDNSSSGVIGKGKRVLQKKGNLTQEQSNTNSEQMVEVRSMEDINIVEEDIFSNYKYKYLRELYLNNLQITDKTVVNCCRWMKLHSDHKLQLISWLNNRLQTSPYDTMEHVLEAEYQQTNSKVHFVIDEQWEEEYENKDDDDLQSVVSISSDYLSLYGCALSPNRSFQYFTGGPTSYVFPSVESPQYGYGVEKYDDNVEEFEGELVDVEVEGKKMSVLVLPPSAK